jgi:hypothetical protein
LIYRKLLMMDRAEPGCNRRTRPLPVQFVGQRICQEGLAGLQQRRRGRILF